MPVTPDGRLVEDAPAAQAGLGDSVISIQYENTDKPDVVIDPATGAQITETGEDGDAIVDLNPSKRAKETSDDFNDNLALELEDELGAISADILEGIEADLTSRKTWEQNLTDSMTQLGLQRESRTNLDLDTISKIRHPILLETSLDFWANFVAEFLPADGPVKVRDDSDNATESEEADRLENDFNHYLTVTASEYYPDTSRAGFRIGFIGGIAKKVFYCALRERPVSEAIYLEDLIVSNDATDLENAKRVTHRMMYLTQDVTAMQAAGVWRDVTLGDAQDTYSTVKAKVDEIQGTQPSSTRPEDKQHTIYECHTKRIIEGDKKAKERIEKGLSVPYRITVDKDSRQILAIYRNWKEGNKNFKIKQQFVPWFYAPGLGFYPIGQAQILGNDTSTLTALWREMVDAGMFANFPGFLYLDSLGRQDTNRFRIPPAGGQPIKAPPGMSIQNSIMPVPYKEISSTLFQFSTHIEDMARRKAGAAKIPVGEGKTDIPVGSLLMFVEQSTKMVQAIHKGLHAAQKKEFELLKDLFVEDPEALTKFNDDPNQQPWTSEQLQNHNLAPASDPNTPSHIHRISVAMAMFMMAQQAPQLFNLPEIAEFIMKVIRVPNPKSFLSGDSGTPSPQMPAAPPPDPAKMAAVQQKAQTEQRKAANEAIQAQQEQEKTKLQTAVDMAKTQSAEKIAVIEQQTERMRLAAEERKSQRESQTDLTTNSHKLAVDLARDHMKNQAAQGGLAIPATNV